MAQNLMVCQFCETSNEPKYKCVNCDLILCEGCKIKIHTKIKKTEVHQVLDLKEFSNLGASETIRHLDLKDIQCSIHSAEQCIIYCENCKVLLCAVCLLESHQTHTLAKIAEVYHKKVKELQELENKIHQELPFYADLEKELKKIKTVENDQYNEIKQRILKKESELKENITKQRENLITELDKLWKPREEEISTQLKDTAGKCDALTRNKAQIEETFQSHNANDIFTASGKLDKDLPTRPVNTISEQKLLFSETRNLEDTKEVFGSVLKGPDCKITGSFTLDTVDSIHKIQTLENNTNILCLYNKSTIKSFELKDSKCITTSIANDTEVSIYYMTKTNNNTLLFTIFKSSEIKCLSTFTPDSKIETFTSISPLYARGIHATIKNIFIGFREAGKLFPLQKESRRGILVYDYNCRHMRTYEYDTNNQRLFTAPDVITTNINEDICVIDITNKWEGRVVVLGKYGNLKWTYNGHSSINSKKLFIPMDLVTTLKGLILVSDYLSNAIHMLSMEGCLVTCLNENHGIEKPWALNINQVGQLQIGCSSKDTKSGLSKILTLDISS